MARTGRRWRETLAAALLGVVLALSSSPVPAGAQDAPAVPTPEVDGPVPTAAGVRGGPVIAARRPLAEHGYVEQEFFFGGAADVHEAAGTWGEDGRWTTTVTSSSPYRTRMLVRRPIDPSRFNGNVVVSWLNVDGSFENDPEWALAADELMREGTVYVGVSAQSQAINGLRGAVLWDATRYGSLGLGDDNLSYDVFSQAGELLKHPPDADPLDGLSSERRLIASGQSQSAQRLVTYINAFHPTAQVYDAFMLLSRFAGSAPLGAAPDPSGDESPDPVAALFAGPPRAKVRDDTDVPVFVVLTETEVQQNDAVRRADSDLYRTWEVAGSSHADTTLTTSQRALAKRDFPLAADPVAGCPTPNSFPTAQAVRAAYRAMSAWVADGDEPPTAPRITRDAATGAIERDKDGNALGGLRVPDIEVPTARHSGESGDAPRACSLLGATVPFDDDVLAERYPDRDAYAVEVAEAARAAVDAGYMVPEDAQLVATAATRSIGAPAVSAGAATPEEAAAAAGSPAEVAASAGAGTEAGASAPGAPDQPEAKRSDPGWMASTGRDLITPVLIGLLLLLNGRVVLTIANERRSGR